MWVVGEVTENWLKVKQAAVFPLGPTYSTTMQQCGLPHPGKYPRLHPLLHNRCSEEKNTAQMKEQIKAPEKIQLSNDEVANLSEEEFKTLVIRTAHRNG